MGAEIGGHETEESHCQGCVEEERKKDWEVGEEDVKKVDEQTRIRKFSGIDMTGNRHMCKLRKMRMGKGIVMGKIAKVRICFVPQENK